MRVSGHVTIGLSLLGVVVLVVASSAVPDAPTPEPPVAVFAELDGSWAGTFVGWDASGRELYRIAVRQTYRTVNETTQRVVLEDRLGDGRVVTGEGVNLARRREDGSLVLRCRLSKSTGERVEHTGTLVEGPGGRREILWHSREGERVEIFRERVVEEGGETFYLIDGMGRYGDDLVLMAGRYRRVEEGVSDLQEGLGHGTLGSSSGLEAGTVPALPGPPVSGADQETPPHPLRGHRVDIEALRAVPDRGAALGATVHDTRP